MGLEQVLSGRFNCLLCKQKVIFQMGDFADGSGGFADEFKWRFLLISKPYFIPSEKESFTIEILTDFVRITASNANYEESLIRNTEYINYLNMGNC